MKRFDFIKTAIVGTITATTTSFTSFGKSKISENTIKPLVGNSEIGKQVMYWVEDMSIYYDCIYQDISGKRLTLTEQHLYDFLAYYGVNDIKGLPPHLLHVHTMFGPVSISIGKETAIGTICSEPDAVFPKVPKYADNPPIGGFYDEREAKEF